MPGAKARVTPDRETRSWIRDAADERAARAGYRFDPERAAHAAAWIQRTCRLYEGEHAGQLLELRDWQLEATLRLFGWVRHSNDWGREVRRFRRASIWVPKKNKKAMALGTPVPTPFGWTTIGELRPGDQVFGEDGRPCRVVETHPVLVDEETYELTFSNGERAVCNGEHLWETRALQRSTVGAAGKPFAGNGYTGPVGERFRPLAVRTTSELVRSLKRGDGAANHSLSLPAPLDLPERDLPLDPYVLGCWLGDGDSDQARITAAYDDWDKCYAGEFCRAGFATRVQGHNSEGAIRFAFCREGDPVPLRTALRRLGLFKNKHVPACYLRASAAQRLALLQGLMDTDGCADKSGKNLTYCSKLPALANAVAELLASLGVKHRLKRDRPVVAGRQRTYFTIQFHAFRDRLPVFRLPRKLERMRVSEAVTRRARSSSVQITAARRIPAIPVRCISVDNPSGLFLFGRSMLPTHNSPTLAAWGLYLLCGDGEQGQKVYSVAKDGKQAMISHTHAIEMVRRSPELAAECSVNMTTGQIAHHPTSSVYKVVAGDNPQSQEGLNGSLMVDETHVVDRRLMKILRGAGISRAEPLHIEVSTAGNNPDSYGKERFDHGKKVAAGEPGYEDEHLLYLAYAAPQDLADADLDRKPARYGKLANPAWGHTIKPSEYLADYRQARRSLSDLADFKMYRLNIWQQAASPWLKEADWAACRREFRESDLVGQECWAGLDLSKTRDMSALVLVFRGDEPETFRVLPYLWLPEQTAREKAHLAPFLAWAATGHLELTPGGVLDYGYVRSRFRQLASRFVIRELAYDQTYAEETTQALEQGVLDRDGKVIEEGTGVARFVFRQRLQDFAGPTADWERQVIAGRLHHNGHPILSWQIGHVQVKTDSNNNKRPVKPAPNDHRKIDAVIAGIMALSRAMMATDPAPATIEVW